MHIMVGIFSEVILVSGCTACIMALILLHSLVPVITGSSSFLLDTCSF